MKEIWKDVKGYEGLYQVSNKGSVKSLQNQYNKNDFKNIILKQLLNGKYLCVNLYKNAKLKKFLIHRLVAEAFISNPSNYPCINHKDENKLNNCVENLEWCTYKYNNSYGNRLNTVSKNNSLSKSIAQYSLEGKFICKWENVRFAIIGNNFFEKNNTKLSTIKRCILNCCKGQRKTAYKYKWKFIET